MALGPKSEWLIKQGNTSRQLEMETTEHLPVTHPEALSSITTGHI